MELFSTYFPVRAFLRVLSSVFTGDVLRYALDKFHPIDIKNKSYSNFKKQ